MLAAPGLARVLAGLAIMTSAAGACAQQTEQLSLPNVTVTAPATPIAPPYQRDPGKAYERNPYSGRYRVEGGRINSARSRVRRLASLLPPGASACKGIACCRVRQIRSLIRRVAVIVTCLST